MAESCWDILGIERTKDKLAIKKAYAKLAHSISPEDDPDGFRRIHTAYKQAMDYASGSSRMPFLIRMSDPDQEQRDSNTDKKKEITKEPSEESDSGYDFASVEREKKSQKKDRADADPVKEEEKKDTFDFASVDTDDREFSDDIELCLERIVNFKEENGIDTAGNVARWKERTLFLRAQELFYLYQDLYVKSGEIGVWNVFFEEALVVKMMIDSGYRSFLCGKYSEGTEAGTIIWQECDFYRRHVEEKVIKSENRETRSHEEDKKAVFNLLGFLGGVIVLIPLTLLVYYAGPWGKKVFPGLILVVSEVMLFFFFRFFTTVSSSTPSPFEPGLTETACFISIMCLVNMLYWSIAFSTMKVFSALNIMFIVAGGILGGIVAVFMTLKVRRDAEEKNS